MLLGLGLIFPQANAEAPIVVETPLPGVSTIETMISSFAHEYGVNERILRATLACESENLTYNGQSKIKDPSGPNGREDSWGYAQIHLPSHPYVSREEALDPVFAIDFAAREFSKGNAWMWTCYRNLPD